MAQEARLVIAIDSERAKRTAQDLSVELDSITKKGDFASKSMDRMSVATRALAGYMAGLVTIGTTINKMDLYTSINNKLKLVTNNQEELNRAMEDTFEIAQRSASSWGAVNDVYSKYMSNAKTLNLTQEQTAKLTEITSKAVAISGSSAESAAAALFQYGQSLDGNILRAEEFNSLVDGAGGLLNAMAKGLGVTRGELRQMMLDGKLTGEVITKALLKAGDSVEELYGKTDKTIGQSLEMLGNSITKFIGEAGKGSGAAQSLSGSIQTLASNLDLIADGALVVGIGYITKAIATKAIAVQASIVASIQNRAAMLAEAQSQVQLLGVEAMRAKQSAALALTELSLARSEYNAATSANARAVAVQRLTAAEIAYNVATKEAIATTEAYSNSQKKLNGIQNSSIGIGRGLLGILSGPVGLGFAAAGVAASFLLMSGNSNKAKDALDDQGLSVDELREKYSKLNAEQLKIKALDAEDLKSDELKKIKQAFIGLSQGIQDLQAQGKTNQANALTMYLDDLRAGGERAALALANLESKKVVEPYWIEFAVKWGAAIKSSREEIVKQNQIIDIATGKNTELAKSYGEVTNAVNNQSNALKKLREDANKSMLNDQYWINTYNRNKKLLGEATAKDFADFAQEWRKTNKIGPDVTLTKEQNQILQEQWQLHLKIAAIRDEATNATKEQNKALRDQQKLTKRLVGISGQSGIGTGPHLDVRYGGSLSGQKVSNEHLARLQAGGKPLTSYKISSNYGPRKAPTKGASSFHKGIDFSMPEGTPITTNVAVKDIKTWYDSKGGGYVSEVLFEDGVSLKLLHQSPKMQSKVKGGASKGSDKAAGDIQSQLDRQLDAQRSLENEVASEVQRIQNNLKVRLEDVDKAGFSPERTAEIKAELQRRADNDVAIAKQAIRSKLEDYKEFQKTEEQLLEESFNRKKFNAAHDIELSKSEQKQAVELLEQQYRHELGLVKLAQEQRLFQAKISYMHEVDAMRERYRLEREEISKTVRDPKQRGELLNASARAEDNEFADKRRSAWDSYRRTQGEMDGTSEYVNLDINYEEQAKVLEDAKKYELITAEEHEAAMFKIKQDYKDKKLALDLEYGQQAMSSLTSIFGSMFGEQSKAYKVMFAADKAYAIAVAGIEIQKGISKAIGLGFPANIPVIAQVVAQGASIFSNIRAIKDQGFSDGGFTGSGGKYEPAGIVHKGEVVWSQEDIKRWGGVGLVEKMRKSANPEAFLNNNASADSVMRRALMSSNAFIESQKQADIFNQPVQDTQIIYKGNRDTPKLASSANSDLFHDGKVYFSSNGLVQDRSNLDDVQDFTLGRTSRPQAEIMPSIEPSTPTINFKIEVINQVSGATVEAEQLDEQTVRIIVTDELDKQLPRKVPKLVSDQIANPNSTISRSLTENTTARRNRT
ncbi:tape measure protein [Acinetobacter baumannii]|uniref:tape measure protein n=3 Tax=Acinetobacter baumannii TaxID=470 RepID=UPI00059902D8|nr:tape measure protein [Acinetobacter baumannii]EKT9894329.1 tape measure protein [Acinetobacter baumannii]EKU5465215.1 tape measure protein [Acinetobacter baumannii]EKW5813026.1 tape measure protein [Acinetobacter baumannii]EKX4167263.1 tape measure protein [Acinetobacter baumannii]ELA6948191.1 tape measure protein [Acinetobacter baumannii]